MLAGLERLRRYHDDESRKIERARSVRARYVVAAAAYEPGRIANAAIDEDGGLAPRASLGFVARPALDEQRAILRDGHVREIAAKAFEAVERERVIDGAE